MKAEQLAGMAALLCSLALGGLDTASAASGGFTPAWESFPTVRHANETRLFTVQSGPRSYMEGRGFQSYQRDRGFSGERQFGGYPSAGDDSGSDRLYGLRRPRTYGPSENRCAGWSRRCDQRWGGGNPDYYGCMRYHGCR